MVHSKISYLNLPKNTTVPWGAWPFNACSDITQKQWVGDQVPTSTIESKLLKYDSASYFNKPTLLNLVRETEVCPWSWVMLCETMMSS